MNNFVEKAAARKRRSRRTKVLVNEFGHLWTRVDGEIATTNRTTQTVAFCSRNHGEGTTSVAANYAAFLGEQGQRITLVEANFRTPSLANNYGVADDPGLWQLLEGTCQLEEVLHQQVCPGVNLIPAGRAPINFSVGSDAFQLQSVFQELENHNDCVVVDAPPLNTAPETSVILPQLDGVVLVVEGSRYRSCAVARSVRAIKYVNATLVGCVLNKVSYDLPAKLEDIL